LNEFFIGTYRRGWSMGPGPPSSGEQMSVRRYRKNSFWVAKSFFRRHGPPPQKVGHSPQKIPGYGPVAKLEMVPRTFISTIGNDVLRQEFPPFIVRIRYLRLRAGFLLETGDRFSHYFISFSGMKDYGDIFTWFFLDLGCLFSYQDPLLR